MRLRGLDLNILISLDALLTERSVSKAARRVFLTQSAMSLALARLREYFHDPLLRQVGKTMIPTPLAVSLVQPIRDVLLQVDSIALSNVAFDPAKSERRFTVLASDYTIDVLMKGVVSQLERVAPGVRLEFPPFTSKSEEEFAKGNIDFLIVPVLFVLEDHPSELLLTDKFTCVVWSKNAMVGDRISLDQYKAMGHVCVNLGLGGSSVPTYDQWILKEHGASRRVEVVVPSFELVLKLVSGTQRIAMSYVKYARMHAKQYSLRLVEPPFRLPRVELYLQWHRCMNDDTALTWFRGLLKSADV